MSKTGFTKPFAAGIGALTIAAWVSARPGMEHIVTRVTAEIAPRAAERGGTAPKLQAAQRVVPGDVLVYTVEVHNDGRYAADSPLIVQPLPRHMMYVAQSAVGPGVDVDFSIDGGSLFDRPENLQLVGAEKPAPAASYTHIRWHLHNSLKPGSTAYLRFRAQVK